MQFRFIDFVIVNVLNNQGFSKTFKQASNQLIKEINFLKRKLDGKKIRFTTVQSLAEPNLDKLLEITDKDIALALRSSHQDIYTANPVGHPFPRRIPLAKQSLFETRQRAKQEFHSRMNKPIMLGVLSRKQAMELFDSKMIVFSGGKTGSALKQSIISSFSKR